MDANDIKLQALINAPRQYIIPVFQRYYSWLKDNWDTLWEDIEELSGPKNRTRTHFLGSLVFFPLKTSFTGNPTYQVIDGQQRLMTFSILFCALRNLARKHGLTQLETEIHRYFLVHEFKDGTEHFRVYPRQRDRDEYLQAVLHPASHVEGRIGEALEYFTAKIETLVKLSPAERLQELFDLLKNRLDFVYIELGSENPYEIFKSLNSTGVPLSEADLIRNFVFMHVDVNSQDVFDDKYWCPLEAHFEYKEGEREGELSVSRITSFFRDYLMQDGQYVGRNKVFETFQERFEGTGFDPTDLARELEENASLYDIIRGVRPHRSKKVNAGLGKLRELESSTTYPLLLSLLHREKRGEISSSELGYAVELITGFILRRYACVESSRGYGRWFVRACGHLKERPLSNLSTFLIDRGFPTDDRFKEAFRRFPWYTGGYSRSVLEHLERAHIHKEPADLSEATIEHIMPQTLSERWRHDLGPEAERVHDEWLHSIGNLTLSAYNPELRNHPFTEKRLEYERSNVTLNRQLAEYAQWSEAQIQERGKQLAEIAAKIWVGPGS